MQCAAKRGTLFLFVSLVGIREAEYTDRQETPASDGNETERVSFLDNKAILRNRRRRRKIP